MGFYSQGEIEELGFKSVGKNVSISRKASFYGATRISLGDNVRIDDYCVFSAGSGGISLGSYVHIAVFCSFIGDGRISMGDFSTTSSRVAVYSSCDDFSGQYMTNPTVPSQFTSVDTSDVLIGRHVIIGSGSVLLPNAYLGDGCAIGAMSLVKGFCDEWFVYGGAPAIKIKERDKCLLKYEKFLTK